MLTSIKLKVGKIMVRMKLFERANEQDDIPNLKDNCSIYCAYQDDSLKGYCIFRYHEDIVILLELKTDPIDSSLADGLARAALSAAENRMKTTVRVEEGMELDDFVNSIAVFTNRESTIDEVLAYTECKR